jgi:nicotinamidase-related amidase
MGEPAPFTLLGLTGKSRKDFPVSNWVVVTIDAQEEYRSGILALPGIASAIAEGVQVLARARAAHIPIIHVVHKGASQGKTFAYGSPYFDLFPEYELRTNEPMVEKTLPNAFANTNLLEVIRATGRTHLILLGFMTHMCVSSTARAVVDHGFLSTVVASACASRDLAGIHGEIHHANTVHELALTELSDRFAFVVQDCEALWNI